MKILLIAPLAMVLAGCGLDALEGRKSKEQVAYENGTLPPNLWAEPINISDGVAPEPQPECTDHVYRIFRCVGGKKVDWYYE